MVEEFPDYWDAPHSLLKQDGNCGLITAWSILKYFRKRTSSEKLIKSCRYTKKYGVFTIALAVCFKEYGLSVQFYTDVDPAKKIIERRCYKIAERKGIEINEPIQLRTMLSKVNLNTIAVVSYLTDDGNGHLSPVIGYTNSHVYIPYEIYGDTMNIQELARCMKGEEIYRQCLLVSSS